MAEASLHSSEKSQRPLSPHLQIYRPLINMVMSILHRLTGVALYFGAVGLAFWLFAAAHSEDCFTYISSWFASWPGRLILFGYTWALMHHMFGGIRHFIWDFGYGYDLKTIDVLSWGTLVLSAFATGLIWIAVCWGPLGAETLSRGV